MLFNQLSKEIPVKVPFLLRAGWWPTALDEISRDHRFLQIRIISYSRHFGRFATEFPYGLSSLTRLPPLYRSNLPNDSVANGYPLNSLWVHNISWYSLSLSLSLSLVCLFVCFIQLFPNVWFSNFLNLMNKVRGGNWADLGWCNIVIERVKHAMFHQHSSHFLSHDGHLFILNHRIDSLTNSSEAYSTVRSLTVGDLFSLIFTLETYYNMKDSAMIVAVISTYISHLMLFRWTLGSVFPPERHFQPESHHSPQYCPRKKIDERESLRATPRYFSRFSNPFPLLHPFLVVTYWLESIMHTNFISNHEESPHSFQIEREPRHPELGSIENQQNQSNACHLLVSLFLTRRVEEYEIRSGLWRDKSLNRLDDCVRNFYPPQ